MTLAPMAANAQTASAKADQESGVIAEVVVTAQRREERLKDVPIAITSTSAEQLQAAGISGATELGLVTPGLNFAVQGAFAQPTIRGIGTSVTGPGADANVSLYIDGVYQPSQTANLFDFNNISRVDVLKGPQGTLFGRNATGGAIMITTLDPSFHPSADVSLSYGSFNETKLDFYGTTGLTDDLAVDTAVMFKHDDGYIRNITTGAKIANAQTVAVRSKLLYKPTADLSFVLSGNYSNVQDNSPFAVKPIDGDNALSFPVYQAGLSWPASPYKVALDLNPEIRTKSYGGSLTGKYNSEIGAFSSITSYERVEPYLLVDIDGSPLPASDAQIFTPEITLTQELNYASKQMGPVSWIGGLYYYNDNTHLSLGVGAGAPPVFGTTILGRVKTDAEAVFAEVNLDVTDRIRLIGGARYSSEEKQASASIAGLPCSVVGFCGSSTRWDSFTPRASIRYSINDASNVYFTFSEGFKSGNYNVSALSSVPVAPEKIDAYEVGYKLSSGSVNFNTSAYYYDYRNLQVQIQQNNNGVLTTLLQNAATAKIYGIDADLSARVSEDWRITAGAAYTHARYESYPGAILTTPTYECVVGGVVANPDGACTGAGMTFSTGNSQAPGSANGKQMIRTPPFTANLTASYSHPLEVGFVEASATASYNSGFYWDPGNSVKQGAYTVLNATASWISPDRDWTLSVWGKNLANQRYYFYSNQTSSGTAGAIARPISGGVSVEYKFR